jgi:hypothetical protein
MCEPNTLIMIAMAATAASGAATAHGQRQMGRAADRVAQRNAKITEVSAADAARRGAVAEDRHRMQVRQFMGRQRAAMGGSGISMDTGTSLDIQTDTARMGELDALTIRNNAAREAWGYRVKAHNYRVQGKMDRAAGRNAAIGTLLTTAASVASMGTMLTPAAAGAAGTQASGLGGAAGGGANTAGAVRYAGFSPVAP